jgi:hypothetical protein
MMRAIPDNAGAEPANGRESHASIASAIQKATFMYYTALQFVTLAQTAQKKTRARAPGHLCRLREGESARRLALRPAAGVTREMNKAASALSG